MVINFSYKLTERIISQLLSLILTMVLARILDVGNFGLYSFCMIFINLAELFVSDFLSTALMQKKEADRLDYSTLLTTNLVLAGVLYLLIFLTAPLVETVFPRYEGFANVIRILSIRFFFAALHSVQLTYICREMQFRKLLIASVPAAAVASVAAVLCARKGFGVYALVCHSVLSLFLLALFLLPLIGKYPGFKFSKGRLSSLSSFGLHVLNTSILIQSFEHLKSLLIGKSYVSSDLAYYDKGKQYPYLIVSNINASMVSVLFSRLAEKQNDREAFKDLTAAYLRFSSYLIAPIMLGLYAVSEDFILLFLGDKWLPCVPLLKGFCLTYLFYPLHSVNNLASKALGKSDICFRVEVIKKIIEMIFFLIFLNKGLTPLVFALAAASLLNSLIDIYPNVSLCSYSYFEQFRDFGRPVLLSILMALGVCLIGMLELPPVFRLVVKVLTGTALYLLLSLLSGSREFRFILDRLFRHS